MLSTKYSVQLLARNFRTGVRLMSKRPNDIDSRERAGTDKKVTSFTEEKRMKNVYGGSKTFVHGIEIPSDVDICIIGGGAIGSSIAYFLKEKAKQGLNIVVVEKDKTVRLKITSDEVKHSPFHFFKKKK